MVCLPQPAHADAALLRADACPIVVLPEDDAPEARLEHMRRGVEAARKSDFQTAHLAFRKAWCAEPSFAIAASLADVEMKLGKYLEASRHWLYFLKHAPLDRTEQRKNAHEQLAECRRHLGRLQLIVQDAPSNATVQVDGQSQDWKRGDELWLAPGEHTIVAQAGERRSAPRTVTIHAGQTQAMDLVLPAPASPEPAPAVTTASTPPPADREAPATTSSTRTALLITGASLTAVAAGAGVVFTLQGNAAEDDWERLFNQLEPGACAPSPDRPPLCDDLRDKAEAMDAAEGRAIGSFIAAGVFGAATVATYFLWPTETKARALTIAPWSLHGAQGLQLQTKF